MADKFVMLLCESVIIYKKYHIVLFQIIVVLFKKLLFKTIMTFVIARQQTIARKYAMRIKHIAYSDVAFDITHY